MLNAIRLPAILLTSFQLWLIVVSLPVIPHPLLYYKYEIFVAELNDMQLINRKFSFKIALVKI